MLGGLSAAEFLRDHWQKKPLIVRGAIPGFRDPITPEELAGLSCEDGVESRLVRAPEKKRKGSKPWEVAWGPHDEAVYASLPDEDWTILVQEVNRWVPEVAAMLDAFSFLPNVRVDDVMISYATPGGGVGPHIDSYDVFLIQGQGKRRWQIHTHEAKGRERTLIPNIDLRVLERFEPDADEVFESGDLLYLPPGFAHYGTAVTSCLTYSIGFRSPSAGEAWSSFASSLSTSTPEKASRLLEDPPLSPARNPGEIPKALLERVRTMIRSMDTSDDAIDRWFGKLATSIKPGHSFEAPSKTPSDDAIMKRLDRGDLVVRSEEGRFAYLRGGRLLYVGGVEIDVGTDETSRDLARTICAARRHDGRVLRQQAKTRPARQLLVSLFAMGALRFSAPSRRA